MGKNNWESKKVLTIRPTYAMEGGNNLQMELIRHKAVITL
jgi:hypothetical protein